MRNEDPRPQGVVFIPGATAEQAREMQQAALTPEGTLLFRLSADQLYQQAGSFTVLEIPTGATFHWVTRDAERRLRYVHATPGTGTREATLDLPELVVNAQLMVALVWSASSTRISAGFGADDIRQAEGVVIGTQVRVTTDGVYVVGDAGVEVAGYQVFVGGKPVLQESAMEVWKWTGTAVDVHMRGAVVEGEKGKVV